MVSGSGQDAEEKTQEAVWVGAGVAGGLVSEALCSCAV